MIDRHVVKPASLRELWRQGVAQMELDKVRVTSARHVYEDAGGVRHEHAAPCRDDNCQPYHRFVCRDCTDESGPCERMRTLMGEPNV